MIKHKGLLFWLFPISILTWLLCIIPGVINWLSNAVAYIITAVSAIIIFPAIMIGKKKTTRMKSFKIVVDWKDWMGLIISILVIYAIKMKVDPISLIKAIGAILNRQSV